jgi:hypothetical protein
MKGKVQLGDMGIDGKVLLKWILNMIGRREVDSSGSWQGSVAGFSEQDNGSLGFIKCGRFPYQLNY